MKKTIEAPSFPVPSDAILIRAYRSMGVSADRIAGDWRELSRLLSKLPPKFQGVQPSSLVRRLINLRKAGRLPRLLKLASPSSSAPQAARKGGKGNPGGTRKGC